MRNKVQAAGTRRIFAVANVTRGDGHGYGDFVSWLPSV